jgi:hypothetical protein
VIVGTVDGGIDQVEERMGGWVGSLGEDEALLLSDDSAT